MSSRTLFAATLIGLISVMLIPAARAETNTQNALRVAGQVTKIDGKTLTIIATDGKDAVITCTDATKISRDGDKSIVPATFEDVQVGQSVRAYYSKTDNSAAAVIIAKSVPAKSAP